ncbi:hypothetical protein Vafri_5657 [Volvox africanus]|nr:hypothetical protein Vafri_5657 [Volvox africanus]
MDMLDPERVAKVYIMQWMHENGLHNALKALEKEIGLLYDDSQLPVASQLMQLIWRHVEGQAQQDQLAEDDEGGGDDGDTGAGCGLGLSGHMLGSQTGIKDSEGRGPAASSQRRHHEEALRLLRAGANDYAAQVMVAEVPAEVHRSNIIAVRMVPKQNYVVTAAGDGYVRCVRYGTDNAGDGRGGASSKVVWEARVSDSALLSLALHPEYSRGLPLVAAGAMDGRVAVLHGPTGATIATLQPHTKYVVRVAWAPALSTTGGSFIVSREVLSGGQGGDPSLILVSASTDETIVISRLDLDLKLDLDLDVNLDVPRGDLGEARGLSAYPCGREVGGPDVEDVSDPIGSDRAAESADRNERRHVRGPGQGARGADAENIQIGNVNDNSTGGGDGGGGDGGAGGGGGGGGRVRPACALELLRESDAEGLGQLKIVRQARKWIWIRIWIRIWERFWDLPQAGGFSAGQ